ncbi:hypothetical protein ID866_5253 [Astraeus odoratus]|nr:hypothetical protein ID866_5253 [Astraeus odoratus]
MPAIRESDLFLNEMDDDDGMPPLVDNPNPSMTFTFFTDMTPITALSADPTVPFETVWESPVLPEPAIDLAETPEHHTAAPFHGGPERTTGHSKKRDASYIPRPPNAFILFRSSFIRSQQVPEKVEGNHSTLSKIIGKYWKTLPREEREVWEAKALVAQAEHRRRYPDWRFRPGANALAKIKVKDGPANTRRRNSHSCRKGRVDSTTNKKSEDERCAIIADLLVEGKKGVDLEDAVRRWEDSNKGAVVESKTATAGEGRKKVHITGGDEAWMHMESVNDSVVSIEGQTSCAENSPNNQADTNSPHTRSQTPDAVDNRFKIPLTAMFKRSLSAPASQSPSDQQQASQVHTRQDSVGSAFANINYDTFELPLGSGCDLGYDGNNGHQKDIARAVLAEPIGDLSPLVLPSGLGEGDPARWNNPYNLLETSIDAPPPPAHECPGLAYNLSSPVEQPFANYGFSDPNESNTNVKAIDNLQCYQPYPTPVKHWADSCAPPNAQMPIFVNEFGGGPVVYDWCSGGGDGIYATLPYSPDQFGTVELVCVHSGYPVVKY